MAWQVLRTPEGMDSGGLGGERDGSVVGEKAQQAVPTRTADHRKRLTSVSGAALWLHQATVCTRAYHTCMTSWGFTCPEIQARSSTPEPSVLGHQWVKET